MSCSCSFSSSLVVLQLRRSRHLQPTRALTFIASRFSIGFKRSPQLSQTRMEAMNLFTSRSLCLSAALSCCSQRWCTGIEDTHDIPCRSMRSVVWLTRNYRDPVDRRSEDSLFDTRGNRGRANRFRRQSLPLHTMESVLNGRMHTPHMHKFLTWKANKQSTRYVHRDVRETKDLLV